MVKHSHRRLPNERAADFIYRCRSDSHRHHYKVAVQHRHSTNPIFLKLVPAEILVSDSLCNIFNTYNNFIIYIALHTFKSCRTSNLKQLLLRAQETHLHPKIQPSPQFHFRHLHPQPPSLLQCPQSHKIFRISMFYYC